MLITSTICCVIVNTHVELQRTIRLSGPPLCAGEGSPLDNPTHAPFEVTLYVPYVSCAEHSYRPVVLQHDSVDVDMQHYLFQLPSDTI
jgi:hypothetical protein